MNCFIFFAEVVSHPGRDWIDYAGAIGSIGTFGAFIFLFVSQRENKTNQIRTEAEYEDQQKRSNLQQFESSFFNLLSLYNQITNNLRYQRHELTSVVHGRDVFNEAKVKIEQICMMIIDDRSLTAKTGLEDLYVSHYYREFEYILNHYFRNLYQIYKYIHQSTLIPDKDKPRYARIVSAQLSQNELLAIMFNMLIQNYGYPKFLLLAKEYNILKNFRHNQSYLKAFFELYNEMKTFVNSNQDSNGLKIKTAD